MLLVMGVILVIGCEIPDAGYQIPEEIVIVRAPIKQHPYQTEYERMLYPTVRITAGWSTGSGVVISVERGAYSVEGITILTAAHVVEDQSTVDIELYDLTVITATVVITDTIRDLAILKPQITQINTDKIYKAHLAPESYQAYLFTPIYTVGCSLGLLPRPSNGIITAINTDSWEVSSPILPGNSGGPVFDGRTYEVIGIAVWVKTYQGQLITTMAGLVPVNQIYEFLQPQIHTDGHR